MSAFDFSDNFFLCTTGSILDSDGSTPFSDMRSRQQSDRAATAMRTQACALFDKESH